MRMKYEFRLISAVNLSIFFLQITAEIYKRFGGSCCWIMLITVILLISTGFPPFMNCDSELSDFVNLIQQNRMPLSYAYYTRAGFTAGMLGGEHVAVVLPPFRSPGRSRLNPWYNVSRKEWISLTLGPKEDEKTEELVSICTNATQPWVHCVFRWMHFLRQREKLEELALVENEAYKKALKRTLLQTVSFRLEYVAFYCHLRRALQVSSRGINFRVYDDPYGLCQRVCGDRSGMLEEDEDEAKANGGLIRPNRRPEQCVPQNGRPTVLTTGCVADSTGT